MERLPGFRDFYPEPVPQSTLWSARARGFIFQKWRETAVCHGFQEYDGPPLEPLELFTAKSGDEIIGQLYNFDDKGGRAVALRPEMTPTLARMIASHERNYRKPIKWFAIPQLFRYERQQRGRLREHFQFNADIFGEGDCAADAELIALLIDTLRSFGLTANDFVVRLSSRTAWEEFYQQSGGKVENASAFFQIIDKLERETPQSSAEKLSSLGMPPEKVRSFIEAGRPTDELGRILADLDARGLGEFVRIDYHVVRGLAYYTGPVFEAFARKSDLRAIAGGGRYNHLVKLVSGGKVDMPALGFGMGDVVLAELLRERGLMPEFRPELDAYCLIESEELRSATLKLVQDLRQSDLATEFPLTPAKPDKQFKRALESGARFTIKLTQANGTQTYLARLLSTREEASFDSKEALVSRLKSGA